MRLNGFKFLGLSILFVLFNIEYGLDLTFWQFGFIPLSLWLISFDRVKEEEK